MYAAEIIRKFYVQWLISFPAVQLSSTYPNTAFPYAKISCRRNTSRPTNFPQAISLYHLELRLYSNSVPELSDLCVAVGLIFNSKNWLPEAGASGRIVSQRATEGSLMSESEDYKGQDVCQATMAWEMVVQELTA